MIGKGNALRMKNYIETLNTKIQEYFKILSPEGIPEFLNAYIETPEMQKQAKISTTCGTIYSKMFHNAFWYSSLEHSIGVALIVWNFTKDKKQTLAGLFHDIATPVFKHTIDFMNGDYETQESTEELTTKMICESKEIMTLLEKDGITVEEVDDYHKYPIADNDTPQLSSDRLEYTLANNFGAVFEEWSLTEIREIYQNIEIQTNEEGIEELGFKDKKIAEKFVSGMRKLSAEYIENRTKFSMQFLADIMKKMSEKNWITIEELYNLSEKEAVERIENCKEDKIARNFKIWREATQIKQSSQPEKGKYCVSIMNPKIRYINPLVRQENGFVRINTVSEKAKGDIEKARNFKTEKYAYLDFDF